MSQEAMNDYYLQFVLKKLKKDVIVTLNENENIQGIENIQNINDIITDEVNTYFRTNEITFKEEENEKIKQSKTHVYRDRTQYKDRENMCKARIWNCGMGGQCSRKGIIDEFCKGHAEPKNGLGKEEWWLGIIDKPRPREPINHTGKIHIWND